MMSVDAGPDGLPVIVAKLEGVAVYLDNWGDHRAREPRSETPGVFCESFQVMRIADVLIHELELSVQACALG